MEGILSALFPIFVVFLIFYFLVIIPQHKEIKKRKQMLAALKKGDVVLTAGGIYGEISDIKGEVVELRIAEKTKIKISKESITNLIDKSKISI